MTEMTEMTERMDFADGKYTVINENGKLTALRHGEPWGRDLTGDNLIYWMLMDAMKLLEERDALAADLANQRARALSECDRCPHDIDNQKLLEERDALAAKLAELEGQTDNLLSTCHRLALELECLLLDTKDLAPVSRWWDSAMVALDEWHKAKDSVSARQIPAEPVNVDFGKRGENMFFNIGNQSFLLDYKPEEQDEFDFMKAMLLSAFSRITHGAKTESQPVNARLLDVAVWPAGYCRDPNGKMSIPAGKEEDFNFGYDVGFQEAWEILNSAISAEGEEQMTDVTKDLLEALKAAQAYVCGPTAWTQEQEDTLVEAMSKAIARAESALAEPKPDADGWIPWVGGERPVNPDALVRVRFADFLEEGAAEPANTNGTARIHTPRQTSSPTESQESQNDPR